MALKKKNNDRLTYRLLSLLDPQEQKVFFKFWGGSPSGQKAVKALLKHPGKTFEETFKKGEIKYSNFRVYLTDATASLKDFIAKLGLAEDTFLFHLLLVSRANKNHNPAQIGWAIKNAEKAFEAQPKRGASYFRAQYMLTKEKQTSLLRNAIARISLSEELDQYHRLWRWLEILHLEVMHLDLHKSTAGNHTFTPISKTLLAEIRAHPEAQTGIFSIYLLIYDLLTKDKGDLQQLIRLLSEHQKADELAVFRDLSSIVLNYLIRQTWHDPTHRPLDLLAHLTPIGIRNKWYDIEETLPPSVFIICIKSNCIMGKLKEAREMVDEFSKFLSPNDEVLTVRYVKMLIAYFNKEYKEVLRIETPAFKKALNKMVLLNFHFFIAQSHYYLGDLEDKLEPRLRHIQDVINYTPFRNADRKQVFQDRLDMFWLMLNTTVFDGQKKFQQKLQQSTLPFNHRAFFEEVMSVSP